MGSLTSGSVARRWLTALALVGGFVLCLAAPPASAELVEQMEWSAPFNVDPPPTSGGITGVSLNAVSCPSQSLCVAVDEQGNVITSTEPADIGSAWTIAHVDDHKYEQTCAGATPMCSVPPPIPGSLEGISCPTTSFCVAFDDLGYIFTSTNPTGGHAAWSSAEVGPRYSIGALSCPTASLCVATGTEKIFTSVDPTGGAQAWHSASVDVGPCPPQAVAGCHGFSRNIYAISCPTASFCVAGDWDGNVLTSSEPTVAGAWHVTYVDNHVFSGFHAIEAQTGIGGVSCPDSSHCVATDESGNALISEDPGGGASAWKIINAENTFAVGRVQLSCPSVHRCVAGFDKPPAGGPEYSLAMNYGPFAGGAWNPVSIVSGFNPISFSCPSEELCVSVNHTGGVIIGRAEPLTGARLKLLLQNTSHPPRPSVKALRRVGFCSESFTPPLEGSLTIRWMARAPGKPHSKPHSLASGAYVFHSVAAQKVELKVTAFGRNILRHDRPVAVTEQLTFTPLGGVPVTITSQFRLRGAR